MISVKVKAILHLTTALGGREQIIVLPKGACIADLLVELEKKYGDPLIKVFQRESGELHPQLILMLNGRNILFLNGLKTVLKDGDELFFLPAVGGG